jgi:hypothetical protein
MVYLNGEPKETAVQCFGNNLNELMDNAKLKWNLMQPIQAIFDENGQLVSLILKFKHFKDDFLYLSRLNDLIN